MNLGVLCPLCIRNVNINVCASTVEVSFLRVYCIGPQTLSII
jgi:hypothetical protein